MVEADEMLLRATAALIALAQHGIAPDVQEMLIRGNALRGIAPGALSAAIAAAMRPVVVQPNEEGEGK